MITVLDAHNDLANALGDTVDVPGVVPTIIVPGVRFMKTQRDNILYRAMLAILRNALKTVVSMEKKIASMTLLRIFPNLQITKDLSCTLDSDIGDYKKYNVEFDDGDKPCYIFSLFENIYTVPIPIKNHIDYTGLLNSRINERSDAFATVSDGSDITTNAYKLSVWVPASRRDPTVFEMEPSSIKVTFLKYPRHIKDLEPTDYLEIEDMFYPTMLSLAIQYGLIESQELEITNQLVAMEAQQIGGQNAG